MAKPNSPLTRFRLRLAQWLDASPDTGEAWCIGCALNSGRTLIVPAPGHIRHVKLHHDQQGDQSYITIRVNWGQVHPRYDEDGE